jgi:hypothetical protein
MLKLTSKFVLEVLPYLLSAIIAAIVVPGFLSSQFHGTRPEAAVTVTKSMVSALELVRQDHAAFAPNQGLSALSSRAAQHQSQAK